MSYDHREYWTRLHLERGGRLTAVGYPEMGDGFNEEAYGLRLSAVQRLLARRPEVPHRTVLEGAVGVGAYGGLWNSLGFKEWTGVDISTEAIERLHTRFPQHHFMVLDLSQPEDAGWAGLRQTSWDLVTAIDVLYHFVDDERFESALSNVGGLVAPGRLLLVSDVFPASAVDVAKHVRRRPLASYFSVLGPLGFKLIDQEPVFALLGDPVRRKTYDLRDNTMWIAWRVLSKSIRMLPSFLQDPIGRSWVKALRPIDALLRDLGWSRGTNLELALFQRLSD
jgi:hypothetical protein